MVFNHLIGVRFPVGPPNILAQIKLMTYFVYLIGCYKNRKLTTYIGYTNNLERRVKLHNEGKGAKFTKGRIWKIMYYEKYTNKRKAMLREIYLKKNRKLRNLLKNKYK